MKFSDLTKHDPSNTRNDSSSRKTKTVNVGPISIGGPEFVVIAGPCSIENFDQFLSTAVSVKKSGAVLLRGGIWKLRTSAHTFQGLGKESFQLISEVLKQTGMKLISEITDPRQIEMLEPIVEMYQVGSRNMHNYSLLKELGNTKKPVMLKRGFAAYVDEWIKAAEYICMGGNENVVLCERGIRTFESTTRNTLDLNSVLWVKDKTHFPVIVDPSHAVGMSEFVPQLSLAAAVAGADGIIVEVHPEPKHALSDGRQALTFAEFDNLTKKIEMVLKALGKPISKLEYLV